MKMKIRLMVIMFTFTLLAIPFSANATFIIDPSPGGLMFFLDKEGADVSAFSGHVGGNNTGPIVNVTASGNVDIGSGYANIKPVKDGLLTNLFFTPDGAERYGDFSFRGQLAIDGDVNVQVINHLDVVYDFLFQGIDSTRDFERIGVVSLDGDWLKSVEIYTTGSQSFNQVKQIDFSYQNGNGVAPVPEPGTMMLLGAGMLGLVIFGKRRMNN